MNYGLPTSVAVNGQEYPIRSDYRAILDIIEAITSEDYSDQDRAMAVLGVFYVELPPHEEWEEAIKQAFSFISMEQEQEQSKKKSPKLIDWSQDFPMIISAVNNAAGREVRALDYCHWWTFMGYFDSISSESTFANVVSIRNKRGKGKKLEKWEQEYYSENKRLVDISKPINYTAEEQELLKSLRGE
ncbi:MAG: Gp15 family bacteriophage protein [Candidatus Pelethousia sp.]|nr:Gp15 family bacteriophage protein [Candidatus Pelethousia sp.]